MPLSPALLRIAQVLASSEELTVAELRATVSRESVLALDAVRVINEWAEQVAPLRGVELKDPPVEVDSVRNGVWVDPVLGDLLT